MEYSRFNDISEEFREWLHYHQHGHLERQKCHAIVVFSAFIAIILSFVNDTRILSILEKKFK